MAGLVTAMRLLEDGVDVQVVEARGRVGGRVWSETLVDGTIVERGGEYFDASMVEAHELAAELGLHMTTQGFNPSQRPAIDPDGPTLDELEEGAKAITAYWESLGDVGEHVSIQDVIDGAPVEPYVAAVISARMSSGRAAMVSRVSARWIEDGAQSVAVGHEHSTRIKEGNQALAERLAERLGPERVRRRWPVAEVVTEGGRYVVTSLRGESISADAVVLALPAGVVGRVRVEGLDPRTRTAIAKLGFGQATKLHLTVVGECRPGVRQELQTPFSTWATAGADTDQATAVTGFGSTHESQLKLDVANGPRVFRPLLEAQWPGVSFAASSLMTWWGGDPWAGGAYSYRPTGWTQEDDDFLAAPTGRLFFAGEHTADRHQGAICGAIRSGERARQEVISALG
jgi:monoamine oxidase